MNITVNKNGQCVTQKLADRNCVGGLESARSAADISRAFWSTFSVWGWHAQSSKDSVLAVGFQPETPPLSCANWESCLHHYWVKCWMSVMLNRGLKVHPAVSLRSGTGHSFTFESIC